MIDGQRVVAWTPYGRERTYSILHQYLRREVDRGVVDEIWLCLNVDDDQVDDLRYAYRLARGHRQTRIVERPRGLPRRHPKQRNTGQFYVHMTDPDTTYLRLDDDIVYVHEDAIGNLARHSQASAGVLCSMATMWNNAVVTHFMQAAGIVPREWGEVRRYCMDPNGWANGAFAVKMHRLLLDTVGAGQPERLYLYQDMVLPREQYSVSAFAAQGAVYAKLDQPGELRPDEEESWHTVFGPTQLNLHNVLVGDALVAHYTFAPQQIAVNASDVLDRYRALAATLTS